MKTAIYIHIHKTGGTTLMKLLDNIYFSKNQLTIEGQRYRGSLSEQLIVWQKKKEKIDIIKGHQFYGVHQHLSNPYDYFTLVREPISKTISLYNYLRAIDWVKPINEKNMNIIEFLESGLAVAADNGMARFIAGTDLDEVPYGECNSMVLEKAINNIKKDFCFIGLTQHFDLTLLILAHLFSWPEIPIYKKENITQKKWISKTELSEKELNHMKKFLNIDIALYEYVTSSFFEKVEAILGKDYQKQLLTFQKKQKNIKPSFLFNLNQKLAKILFQKTK